MSLPDYEIVVRGDGGPLYGIHPVPIERYPDGMVRIDHQKGKYGPVEHPRFIVVRASEIEPLFAALFWIDSMSANSIDYHPTLILPFVPGSRQDRSNATGDMLFTLRSVAKAINVRCFERVIVLDPHSDVTPALIDRCVAVMPDVQPRDIQGATYAGIIAPDGGAVRRATHVAATLGLPLYHAWKHRDVSTGKLSGFGVEPLQQGKYLVVDDICDGGATFKGLASELSRQGAEADLYVTHGIFSKGTEKLLEKFDRIYTTDSLVGRPDGVRVIPQVFQLFLGAT